jgi:hypothetical protein
MSFIRPQNHIAVQPPVTQRAFVHFGFESNYSRRREFISTARDSRLIP